ncbi:PPOX class F420-dependent oxidoreductase [Mycolicibacterium baixiangningiae]|uniref:PPOX class F420-dependent oxidoreductase n=1 Tax=Mycolicibacterium baixiangningiae TaxID=2761578 RepID=UPI001866CCA3|nr:PPOX class F420-dependent oxidoreductase [Mycolicibacterium baixiangningiae]
MNLDGSARALIGSGADATLVTLNPDGSPQVSVVWVALRSAPEGDELVAAHLHEYRKTRNIRRDGRVAVTILAPKISGQPTPYLSIIGTARIIEGGAPALSAELAEAMLGSSEHFPPPNADPGFVTRIQIEKVGGSLVDPPIARST